MTCSYALDGDALVCRMTLENYSPLVVENVTYPCLTDVNSLPAGEQLDFFTYAYAAAHRGHLTKKSFTAEEAYYNMLLIDETAHTVYSNDNDFNEVFAPEQRKLAKAAQENAEERAREKLGPQPNQPKSDIYNVLDAYGTQTCGDTVPYVGSSWLSDNVSGGAVFYLLVAARAPSPGLHLAQYVEWDV